MRKDDAMTDPESNEPAAPRLRPVVRAMIWATVPVLLLVQLLASAGVGKGTKYFVNVPGWHGDSAPS